MFCLFKTPFTPLTLRVMLVHFMNSQNKLHWQISDWGNLCKPVERHFLQWSESVHRSAAGSVEPWKAKVFSRASQVNGSHQSKLVSDKTRNWRKKTGLKINSPSAVVNIRGSNKKLILHAENGFMFIPTVKGDVQACKQPMIKKVWGPWTTHVMITCQPNSPPEQQQLTFKSSI